MKVKDYYRVLNVEPTAKPDEIKAAYRRLAFKFHPDVNSDTHAEETFKQITEAYEVLKDTHKRIHYNRMLRCRQFFDRSHPIYDDNLPGGAVSEYMRTCFSFNLFQKLNKNMNK